MFCLCFWLFFSAIQWWFSEKMHQISIQKLWLIHMVTVVYGGNINAQHQSTDSIHENEFRHQNCSFDSTVNKKQIIYRPNRRELIVFFFSIEKKAATSSDNLSNVFHFFQRFRFKYFDSRLLNERFHFILICIRGVNKNPHKFKIIMRKKIWAQKKRWEIKSYKPQVPNIRFPFRNCLFQYVLWACD